MKNLKINSEVTLWYKFSKSKNTFEYNHLENGFKSEDKPLPIKKEFREQNDWVNYMWKKEFCILDENNKIINF